MRLNAPRIEPVDLGRLDADQRTALEPFLASDGGKVGGGRILNIFRTLAQAPKAELAEALVARIARLRGEAA